MKPIKTIFLLCAAVALIFLGLVFFHTPETSPAESDVPNKVRSRSIEEVVRESTPRSDAVMGRTAEEKKDSPEEETTDEEREDAEAEKRVDAFDELTDTWMEPSPKGVTEKDIEAFVAKFGEVPADRKEECLQRALNLVPDENVMLLAGILMDKGQAKELVELVFNDVLNRDEDVKKPILDQIFKDKTHPCWSDVAWIFDVTDEKPE